ncbi:MAG: NAD-dependent epimerase/dehydratase family protein, partial [Nocardioidaceae bacterium]
RLAAALAADPAVERIVGVDTRPPSNDDRVRLGRTEFVRADIRNPLIARVIAQAKVDSVVHASVTATPRGAGGRTSMKELNVIGTMQLLAACQRAPGVRRLVVKSSSTVYGSSPKDPAMFTEDMAPRRLPRSGYGKDSVEVEGYVRGFARRRPDVTVTLLRCANLIGPRIETALTRYFSLPVVPTVLGFDPRLQFCHEYDALAVLELATIDGNPGTFNVAGDGVLTLSQAVRRLGKPSVAVPPAVMAAIGSLFPRARAADISAEQATFLAYGRGLDTTRLRQELGYHPQATTSEAFDSFAARLGPGALSPERVAGIERQVSGLMSKAAAYAGR